MTSTQHRLHTYRAAASASAFAKTAQPQAICLRDGEVVIYRRTRSLLYQCRYKLADGTWYRQTTGEASLEHAIARDRDIYDEARYRQRLGLAHQAQSFAQLAHLVVAELRQQIDAGIGKTAYHSYVSCIERYFLPYFGDDWNNAHRHTRVRAVA
jgi:integrase